MFVTLLLLLLNAPSSGHKKHRMAAASRAGLKLAKLFGVAGKRVLVTGGGRGIGEMIATTFVENGCDVYISSRSADALEKKAEELNSLGSGSCTAIPADLSKGESCSQYFCDPEHEEPHAYCMLSHCIPTNVCCNDRRVWVLRSC